MKILWAQKMIALYIISDKYLSQDISNEGKVTTKKRIRHRHHWRWRKFCLNVALAYESCVIQRVLNLANMADPDASITSYFALRYETGHYREKGTYRTLKCVI